MRTITLFLANQNDKALIGSFLEDEYRVVTGSRETLEESLLDAEMVMLDHRALATLHTDIQAFKQKYFADYLPVLLLMDKRASLPKRMAAPVDEIFRLPIKKAEFALRINNLLKTKRLFDDFKQVLDDSPTGICILQEEKIRYFNPSFLQIFNEERQDLQGRPFAELLDQPSRDKLRNLRKDESVPKQPFDVELRSSKRSCEISISRIQFNDQSSLLINAVDITRRKSAEAELRHKSYHDSLTGLYNRSFLETEMKRLDTSRQLPLGVIMLDINGLKLINDSYGHQVGDEMLQMAADVLRESCRQEDIIARWGGDEFVILLPATQEQALKKISERIRSNARTASSHALPLSIALGTASKTRKTHKLSDVLNLAEDRMYKQKLSKTQSHKNAVVLSFLNALSEKSFETHEHTERMEAYGVKLSRKIGLTEFQLDQLRLLINLHDIGKINLPEKILTKQGPLTDEEWQLMKKHPETGYRIATATEDFSHVAAEILAHHEHWDGSGYPQGLKGDEIPLLSRICAIVDAYEVMLNGRPYKKAMSKEEIIQEFKHSAGKQFDPELTAHFISIIETEE